MVGNHAVGKHKGGLTEMDRHAVRYTFEHRLLPHWFLEDKARFVGAIFHDKNILFRVIDDIFKEEEIVNPYTEDQFDVIPAKITDDVMMLKIVFPEPEEEPLCYCSYLFFDEDFEKIIYFCIEKGNDEGDNYPFVCSWSKEGGHYNYGNCTFEDQNDFHRCIDLYMKNIYGIKEEK